MESSSLQLDAGRDLPALKRFILAGKNPAQRLNFPSTSFFLHFGPLLFNKTCRWQKTVQMAISIRKSKEFLGYSHNHGFILAKGKPPVKKKIRRIIMYLSALGPLPFIPTFPEAPSFLLPSKPLMWE